MSDGFRSPEMAARYRAVRASGALERRCPLCDETSVVSFAYWKVIPNKYPYDRIAERHDMLVPLRHVDEDGLNKEELEEFRTIKREGIQDYEYIIEASLKNKSIPAHHHLHLLIAKSPI